ncbi:hypothetical protein EON64_13615 [archaeon]|nr:MAG: hypothetical protein EON64_13615 [archaeon]
MTHYYHTSFTIHHKPHVRALPKHYPKPKCSERSEEEAKVLNDVVSVSICHPYP